MRSPRELDNKVFGRDWPVWSWLPALTTLQALAVIVVAVIVGGFLPRIELGAGFRFNPGNAVIALGLAVAAFSPKPSRQNRHASGEDEK
jgi:hypothetical protein